MSKQNGKGGYRLSRYEQEVHLSINEEDKVWTAYVSSPYYMRKFERAGWECIDVQYYPNGDVVSKTFRAERKRVQLPKERAKRILTEEEKNTLRERMKLAQEARNKKKDNAEDVDE